jgi:hypothetical protein
MSSPATRSKITRNVLLLTQISMDPNRILYATGVESGLVHVHDTVAKNLFLLGKEARVEVHMSFVEETHTAI